MPYPPDSQPASPLNSPSKRTPASRSTRQRLNVAPPTASARVDGRGSGRAQLTSRASTSRRRKAPLLSPHRQQLLWAVGSITLLAMATILPTQVASQAIAETSCEQVVKSGAEISRGQLSSLVAVPIGSTKEAVRQVALEPYCTLPAVALDRPEPAESVIAPAAKTATSVTEQMIERDAYPLAFDAEAWLVLNYRAGEYQGYDFVFKP